jgi:hypothetical protein
MPAGDVLEERAGYIDAVKLVDGIRCGQDQVWMGSGVDSGSDRYKSVNVWI